MRFSGTEGAAFSEIIGQVLDAAASQMDPRQIASTAEKLNATIFESMEGELTTEEFIKKYGADIMQQTVAVAFDELNPRLAELMRAFDGTIEEVTQYAGELLEVNALIKTSATALGGLLEGLSADDIIELGDAFGGLSEMTGVLTDYVNRYYSESEKLAMATGALVTQFDELGVTMPVTSEGFRALVEGLDRTTEEGKSLFIELMKLEGAFADVADAAIAAARRAADAVTQFRQAKNPTQADQIGVQGLVDQYLAGDPARQTDFQNRYDGSYDRFIDAIRSDANINENNIAQYGPTDQALITAIINATNPKPSTGTAAPDNSPWFNADTGQSSFSADEFSAGAAAFKDWVEESFTRTIELWELQASAADRSGNSTEALTLRTKILTTQRDAEIKALAGAPQSLLDMVTAIYDLRIAALDVVDAMTPVERLLANLGDFGLQAASGLQSLTKVIDSTFDAAMSGIASGISDAYSNTVAAYSGLMAMSRTLREFVKQTVGALSPTLSYYAAKSALVEAKGEEIVAAGQDFIESSRMASLSSTQYQIDVLRTMNMAATAANAADDALAFADENMTGLEQQTKVLKHADDGIWNLYYSMREYFQEQDNQTAFAAAWTGMSAPDPRNREIVARLDELLTETRSGNLAIARNTGRSARVMSQWDGDGMPAERVI
jgi:hypothetical protein